MTLLGLLKHPSCTVQADDEEAAPPPPALVWGGAQCPCHRRTPYRARPLQMRLPLPRWFVKLQTFVKGYVERCHTLKTCVFTHVRAVHIKGHSPAADNQ